MIKLIIQSVRQTILWSIVAGVLYPVVMTIFAQVAFHSQANGSLVEQDGKLIGQIVEPLELDDGGFRLPIIG